MAYGYLAAVIASVFFPSEDKSTALLSTFAVFEISFVIRPLGGIVWGHIGDRVGRREALSLSILIMSASTFVIASLAATIALVTYSGFAFSFNLANTLFGGTAPFMCTWLIKQTGNSLAPAWYLVLAAGHSTRPEAALISGARSIWTASRHVHVFSGDSCFEKQAYPSLFISSQQFSDGVGFNYQMPLVLRHASLRPCE